MTAEQKTNTKFRDFLTEAQKDPQTERHPIGSFLIMPVQRIPRYKMLLAVCYYQVTNPVGYFEKYARRSRRSERYE
jgi:hypothetical protein